MKQKTQIIQVSSLIGRYTKIVTPRRVRGEVGIVQDLFWRKDKPWVLLQLSTGDRVAVAVSWTDLPQNIALIQKKSPVLMPTGLLELARFLQGMKFRRHQTALRSKQQKK